MSCGYLNAAKLSTIVVMYALPVDPNPINDFYYGCGSAGTSWTPTQRTFIVTSPTQWAFAEFTDPYNQVTEDLVPGFEQMTKALLQSATGIGHPCKLVLKPTETTAGYRFSFELSVTRKGFAAVGGVAMGTQGGDAYGGAVLAKVPRGAFQTKGRPSAAGIVKVVGAQVPLIPMTVLDKGQRHVVTLRVERGIDFKVTEPKEKLRFAISVKSSSDPSCRKGAKGTMTITKTQVLATVNGASTISLDICGGFFHGSSHSQVTLQGA